MLLIFLFAISASFASDQLSRIQIKIVNSSLHDKYIQVKDELCTNALSKECELAGYILDSSECEKDRNAEKCVEAQEVVDRGSCAEGLVYSGKIARDETIAVDICTSYSGKGQIAIRNSSTAPWVHYKWIDAGAVIKTH